jgi:hypothetical protein
MNNRLYQFLAWCARAECHADHYRQLRQLAGNPWNWGEVIAEAERHRLAPLLYYHLKKAEVSIPDSARRQLQGLYVRHRRANQARLQVLYEVMAAYRSAGVPALLLKGAALCHLVYPEPGLRPMSDLDILVPACQARKAQEILAGLGFHAPGAPDAAFSHRHLGAATRRVDEVPVAVEIHHRLSSSYWDNARAYAWSKLRLVRLSLPGSGRQPSRAPDRELEAWHTRDRLPVALAQDGVSAYTLGCEDTLAYLCWHLTSHVNVWDFGRLIWTADVVSFAERFAERIDWERVRREHPSVLDTLSLLHCATPLSEELLTRARVPIGPQPQGIGLEYRGWPRIPAAGWRNAGYRRVLRDTLLPPEWWLRLRYRRGSAGSLFWCRWLRHPLHVAGQIARALLERLGWPAPLELAQGPSPN